MHILKEGAKLTHVYSTADLTKGNELTFTATGVIDGPLLQGVIDTGHAHVTHSLVMRAASGTMRYITTHHHQAYDKKRL